MAIYMRLGDHFTQAEAQVELAPHDPFEIRRKRV